MWNIFKFNQETSNELANIKKYLIASMNGVVSENMKHLGYKLNYGVSLLRIKELASRFKPSDNLADCLWKSDCREMMIMATLLHPEETFDEKKALKWSSYCTNMELAEQFSRNLVAKKAYASSVARKLLNSSHETMERALAYLLAATADKENAINKDDFDFIFQQAEKDIYSPNANLYASVARFLKQASTKDLAKTNQFLENLDTEKGPGCAWVREEVRTYIEYAPTK